MNVKRVFDVFFAILGITLLLPVFVILAVLIVADSKGGVFYRQTRVGRNNINFTLFKFRTMRTNAEKLGLLTVGERDPRVTFIGYYLRKYKMDELPQLLNVLYGDMSFVGPRPEVRKYVELYNSGQQQVLSVKPGITDWASIYFRNENQLLKNSDDPEAFYIQNIIPSKINQNLEYIRHNNIWIDLKIIALTLQKVIINDGRGAKFDQRRSN